MKMDRSRVRLVIMGVMGILFLVIGAAFAQEAVKSSYSPVVIKESFKDTMDRMKAAKAETMKRQMNLLNERYDMSDRPANGVMMSGGKKAIQEGVRVKLSQGLT